MTGKAELSTKANIKRRTLENTELIAELNELRLSKTKLMNELENERLKL
jgi:hypothetical protein